MEILDATDARLIDLLRADASQPEKSLAASLGISIATVRRRREALVERGVIRRYTIDVDPSRAGRPALTLVEVSLKAPGVEADFKRRMLDCPDVVECYHLMGNSTYLLLVALADRADLARFSQWLRGDGASSVSIRASPVLDQVKPASSA
jgi:DNA-binding Lrp family transcriptional regulator